MNNISPLAAIWLTVCINSFFPIFGWLAAGRISPALYAFAGSAIGFACFLPWIARNGVFKTYFRPGLWPRLLAVGFFGSALPIALLVTALRYTTPANAAILCQVEAVYALVLAGIFLKEKVTPSQLAGTSLVLAGTMLIALKERFTVRWTGDLMVLAVPLFYQISHLFSKKLPRELSHVFVASARTLFASLGILPLVAFAAARPGALFTPSLELLGILLVFGVALTALNNVLWYRAILNMDLSKATAIVLSYPVLTALLSHAFGIERLHVYQLAGLLLALAGAWWVTQLVKKDAPVPA
ncbi:MAG: DMT family transporter [Elusimicrobia bacterium]|nr:DMT family transporter [Elusimicrobiota bacterium]